MCGITGVVNLDNPKSTVRKMTDRLAHRGPDAEGFFVEGNTALGHRRLSIIDLSQAANQPMYSADSNLVLVFNGEIYNYASVRTELPDYPFSTQSDAEVILAAYEKWGVQCLGKFNGMFAFAIWDRRNETLFIARDRLGVKPLYYALCRGALLFASEMRSVFSAGLLSEELDDFGLWAYFAYGATLAPNTIYREIKQLTPGAYGLYHKGVLEIKQYWSPAAAALAEDAPVSRPEAVSGVRERLYEAVKMRMVADVPLGAFLSGGIDSSVVVALMAECGGGTVNTCSIVFKEKNYDESRFSRLIAERFKTNHREILLRADDFLADLPEAFQAMDQPGGDGFNTYTVSKYTRQNGLKVALSGLGGDEIFAGYGTFREWRRVSALRRYLPACIRKSAVEVLLNADRRRDWKLKEVLTAPEGKFAETYAPFRRIWLDERLNRLPVETWKDYAGGLEALFENDEALALLPELSRFSVGEIGLYARNVLLRDTDQASMAHALEVREPFFDYRLVETVLRVPDQWKISRRPKQLLLDAVGGLLPTDIIDRPKMGFTLPWDKWMKAELKSFCEERIHRLCDRNMLNAKLVQDRWAAFLRGEPGVVWMEIWLLVCFEEWLGRRLNVVSD